MRKVLIFIGKIIWKRMLYVCYVMLQCLLVWGNTVKVEFDGKCLRNGVSSKFGVENEIV